VILVLVAAIAWAVAATWLALHQGTIINRMRSNKERGS
jgi:hypothetical protein